MLREENISYAATTTTGHDNTIRFKFDAGSSELAPYKNLPSAELVLITFPLRGEGQSKHLVDLYRAVHGNRNHWVQLGSTGIFTATHWNDYTSPYDHSNGRAIAEDELLSLGSGSSSGGGGGTTVLNLAGLYGGSRQPRNWVTRVATTKAQVKAKAALHLIHGNDVAKAIVGVFHNFENVKGRRWIVTDLRVYDWWDLIGGWAKDVEEKVGKGEDPRVSAEEGKELDYEGWVGELMEEDGLRALPRGAEGLGRVLDSREFWKRVGIWPGEGRVK
ncbi:hypothetical protein UCRPC4_g03726 [Phaeomoniella chlamydospora]|uniref:Uncharacterized protein n=1 Tax=Phaeomoniella chlamydospora TaxID=158046 RepID=A0A0G2GCU0_PHACM|nr:hypothetical protein UCRPC4_g03726 [Phaeomoniella chlamydospora]